MPSETGMEFVPRRRLHRLSWVFISFDHLRKTIVPLLAFLVFSARQETSGWLWLVIFPLLGSAFWRQWVYRYDFGPRGLVIREGLLFRNVRTLEYHRIENIDSERNLLHRMLNVAQVRVETSSGGGSEAVIQVLGIQDAEDMRRRLFAARDAQVTEHEPQEHALLQLPAAELVRYGLIDNRGLVVVAALFGFATQFGTERLVAAWVDPLLAAFPVDDFATLGPLLQAFFLLSSIVGLIAGTRLLSILLAFITLYDFRLTRVGEDLRVRHGLITRLSLTLRRPRIQAVHQVSSVLHRLFQRVSLHVDLAGGLGGNAEQQHGNNSPQRKLWLAPVCTPRHASELMAIALPGLDPAQFEWRGLAPRARWRLFRLLALTWLLPSLPVAAWFMQWWAPVIVLPVLPLLWLHAHLYVRHTGWALTENFVAVRRGWLTRRITIAPRNRIQSVHVAESPFDRRYGMASLVIDTAGARVRRLAIPYLGNDTAQELANALHSSSSQVFA